MSVLKSDPLLRLGRIVIGGLMALCCIAGAGVFIGLIAISTFKRGDFLAALVKAGVPVDGYPMILAAFFLLVVLFAIATLFLLQLFRIIGSVGEGDPFNPINADRLRKMAWLALASEPLSWMVVLVGRWFVEHTDKIETDADFSFSGSGLVLALILFILARVFRTGAQMREELEGTV